MASGWRAPCAHPRRTHARTEGEPATAPGDPMAERPPTESERQPADQPVEMRYSDPNMPVVTPARHGIVVGLLVVVLLALVLFFFWRGTGARDDGGQRPTPPAQTP